MHAMLFSLTYDSAIQNINHLEVYENHSMQLLVNTKTKSYPEFDPTIYGSMLNAANTGTMRNEAIT